MKSLIIAGLVIAAAAGAVQQIGAAIERFQDDVQCPRGYWKVKAMVVPADAAARDIQRMPRCVPPPPTGAPAREIQLEAPPAPPVLLDGTAAGESDRD